MITIGGIIRLEWLIWKKNFLQKVQLLKTEGKYDLKSTYKRFLRKCSSYSFNFVFFCMVKKEESTAEKNRRVWIVLTGNFVFGSFSRDGMR